MKWLVKRLDAWWAGKVTRSNAYWDEYWVEGDVLDEAWLKGHEEAKGHHE